MDAQHTQKSCPEFSENFRELVWRLPSIVPCMKNKALLLSKCSNLCREFRGGETMWSYFAVGFEETEATRRTGLAFYLLLKSSTEWDKRHTHICLSPLYTQRTWGRALSSHFPQRFRERSDAPLHCFLSVWCRSEGRQKPLAAYASEKPSSNWDTNLSSLQSLLGDGGLVS